MTALGFYMMVSLFMIVAALVEFAVVLIIKHGSQKIPTEANRTENNNAESRMESGSRNNDGSNNRNDAWIERNDSPKSERPVYERIDRACFGMFPTSFVVFNAIYWSSYTI